VNDFVFRDFVTVADMMAALSALPPYNELAEVCLPEAYTMDDAEGGLPEGEVVYRLGHSHQSY